MTPHEQQARALAEKLWDSVIYNKGSIYDIVAHALRECEARVWEEAAKLSVETIEKMIDLYQGKLPYFVVRQDKTISNDASISHYTAKHIATVLLQQAGREEQG